MKQLTHLHLLYFIIFSLLGLQISSCSKNDDLDNNTNIEDPSIIQTSILLLTDHVDISGTDLTATFEFIITPSDTVIEFSHQGEDINIELNQITVVRSGEEESVITKPSNYHITDVYHSMDAQGEHIEGKYCVTVLADANDSDGEEIVSLVITTKDTNGNNTRCVSAPFTITYDTHPDIFGIQICGIEATKTDSTTFYIKLPYGTDTKSLDAEFSTNSLITVGEADAPKELDLSNPIKITATLNGASKEFSLIAYYSNLPVVYLNTPAPILNKTDWVKGSTLQITNAGEYNATYSTSIRGRGNSTWQFPKKPFAIKLDEKSPVLGMPKHKRWCLLANWMDRTNIRNAVAFKIGSLLNGLEWTPSGFFVDLVLNGEFMGNYYLCEQIKADKNRVNIDELKAADIEDESITGGYLLEFDTHYDEEYKFRTDILDLPVNLKSPDENVPDIQLNYIKDYVNNIEKSLASHEDFSKISSLIDIDSYIDWWLLNELVRNWEPNHPKSAYMYKKRDGKLYAGPAWDFDWGTLTGSENWRIKESLWYRYLFTYDEFIIKVKERWNTHKTNLATVEDFIDSLSSEITESSVYDCSIWPLDGRDINGDESFNFEESIALLKKNFIDRYKWIDDNIVNL